LAGRLTQELNNDLIQNQTTTEEIINRLEAIDEDQIPSCIRSISTYRESL
jgi:hypothetical protein